MAKNSITIGGHVIELTNLDKILFPKDKITKKEVVAYYYKISSTMIPYMKNRPVSMLRYPNGINEEGFFQKNAGEYFPSWITFEPIKSVEGKIVHYVVVDKKATLIYLANQLCLTPHIWLSKIDKLNYPDRMIFDLDPSGTTFDFNRIRKTAFLFKELLEKLGLVPFVMTTGSRGLHVVVPLDRKHPYEKVRVFAHDIAFFLQQLDPDHLTLEMRKSKRGKKIFLDYLRNSYTATSVAPYAIRAHPMAPVATPIDWHEVGDAKLDSQRYSIFTIFKRLEKEGDPWGSMKKSARSITQAQKKFEAMK